MRKALLYFFSIAFLLIQSIAVAHAHSDGYVSHNDCELCSFINNSTGDVPHEIETPIFISQPLLFSPLEPQSFVSGECAHPYFSTAPPALI
jgi:hypothetical protein